MIFAIMLDRNAAVLTNSILYDGLVTSDGIHFNKDYMPGTFRYLDPDDLKNSTDERRLIVVTDEIINYAPGNLVIANLIVVTYSREQLRAMGWDYL